MSKTSIATALVLAWSAPLAAQVRVENPTLHRVITQVRYRNAEPAVDYRIEYGPQKWRKQYAGALAPESAGHFRLGTGAWAELTTNAPLVMGAQQVGAGRYYLGIQLSAGEFALTLMQSERVDRLRYDAGSTVRVRPDVRVPLSNTVLDTEVPDLTIELQAHAEAIGRATLRIRFGTHQVEAPVAAEVREKPPAPKFEAIAAPAAKTTASGLVYEVVRAGQGASPKTDDHVLVHYSGWLDDGTPFDSSHDRGEPTTIFLGDAIPGWKEGLQLMAPGALYKFSLAPELGYGARQIGPIPANSTLVFRVELLEVLR